MATFKLRFRASSDSIKGSLYFQVIHERKICRISTSHVIFQDEWNPFKSSFIYKKDPERNEQLLNIRNLIRIEEERLGKIIRNMDSKMYNYSVDDIKEEYVKYKETYSLFRFMEKIIRSLKKKGKTRTADTYFSTLKSFKKFRNDKDLMLDSLTEEILQDYQSDMITKGLTLNTISFYMRILRSVYNKGVESGGFENKFLFKKVYTGMEKTVKRAIRIPLIKKIKNLDLSHDASLEYARDIFLLSFYLRGMSLIDMAFLRKCDLRGKKLSYRRRKTGQLLIIEWREEMQNIIAKYGPNNTPYLLPLIRDINTDLMETYRKVSNKINYNLKKIAKIMKLDHPLTLYVARHSWASAAKTKRIPISVISEGMGHDNESTTQIYLTSFDTTAVDRANSIIINSIR